MQTLFDYVAAHGWVVEAFLIILLTAMLRLVLKFSLDRLARQAERSNNYWDDALVEAGRKPAGIAVWALGISLAAEVIGGDAQAEIFQYINSMRDVAIVWLMVWFALRFIRLIEEHYIASHSEEVRWIVRPRLPWASYCERRLRSPVHCWCSGIWGIGIRCVGLWRHWRYRHRFCGQRLIG